MKSLLLLVACLLTGCATTVNLTQSTAGSAMVVNQMDRSRGFSNWRLYLLKAVDDVPVTYPFMSDGRDDTVKVDAGARRFVVKARFNTESFSNGPWGAIIHLPATVEAGLTYVINGEVRDDKCVVWLEDAQSRQKVSPEASSTYFVDRSQSVTPIFIPVPRK